MGAEKLSDTLEAARAPKPAAALDADDNSDDQSADSK